jgi:hypothetical protein
VSGRSDQTPGNHSAAIEGLPILASMTTSALPTIEGGSAARCADVDIVIPVYNGEGRLGGLDAPAPQLPQGKVPAQLAHRYCRQGQPGSDLAVVLQLTNQLDGVRAIHLEKMGRGRSRRAGWSASPSPVVAYRAACSHPEVLLR